MYCRELFDKGWRAAALQNLWLAEWIVPDKSFLMFQQGFRRDKATQQKNKKFHSSRSEFQPSFIVNLFYYSICNRLERILLKNKVILQNW